MIVFHHVLLYSYKCCESELIYCVLDFFSHCAGCSHLLVLGGDALRKELCMAVIGMT